MKPTKHIYLLIMLTILSAFLGCKTSETKQTETSENAFLTPEQQQDIISRTGWSRDIVGHLRSMEEAEIYIQARLVERRVGGRPALVRNDIDWRDFPCRHEWLKEKLSDWESWQDYNNADLIGEGYPPRDKNGDPYELHHIGQLQDSPYAELTWEEHMGGGNNAILHPKRESDIDRQQFEDEKSAYWQARFSLFTEQEKRAIYGK